MNRVLSRYFEYASVLYFACSRLPRVFSAQLRVQVHLQILCWGIAVLPLVVAIAAITGTIVMTQVAALAGQDNDTVQRVLFTGLFFEIAPAVCGLVLVARSSGAIAAELAVMQIQDEFSVLRRMGVPPWEFLLLPRVWGLAVALPAVTIIFQAVALVSGWMTTALLQDQPLADVAGHFLDFANPQLLWLCLLKCAATGALIGAIACHHGVAAKRTPSAISDASIHAVGNGLLAVFLMDLLFALAASLLN